MISNLIDTYEVLAPHECERIIQYFHDDDRRQPGRVIGSEERYDTKKSTDVYVSFGNLWNNSADDKYNDIILPAVNYSINKWVENHKFINTMPQFSSFCPANE